MPSMEEVEQYALLIPWWDLDEQEKEIRVLLIEIEEIGVKVNDIAHGHKPCIVASGSSNQLTWQLRRCLAF